jgi:hypothetical protein
MAEVVEPAAAGETLEAFGGHGRTGGRAAESLEPAAVAGRNRDVGMECEAGGRGAAGCAGAEDVIRVDTVDSAGRAVALAVETTNGGGRQARQARLVRGQWIGRGRVGLGANTHANQNPVDPAGDVLDDAPNLVIAGWGKGAEAHPGHAVVLMTSVED